MHMIREKSAVSVWTETLKLDTYPPLEPEEAPMFFEGRNIQGASGDVYPHSHITRLSSVKTAREYKAITLENEFLKIVLLPELGGRIFTATDKTNGYDFLYRNNVIKPGLIGLCGPWISGGMEFNWPQHHRPSTFDPMHCRIVKEADGSVTVWMGEHEPLNRTKGMVGVCLHPGKALLETKVRLYNRTPLPQTFLWWANAAVKIDKDYQVIFPPDVHCTFNHLKNPVSSYPFMKGMRGIEDYGDGADCSYWANSKHPTSFFAAPSRYDFFGGYDHTKRAGVVHVADAAISPGKKFFTWANGPAGHAWQRNLTDEDGEYLELMAGVHTDNQPDFSWIMPHETKSFSQYWFPVQELGGMKNANLHGAVNLEVSGQEAKLGFSSVETLPGATVALWADGKQLLSKTVDLRPGQPFIAQVSLPENVRAQDLLLQALDSAGVELISYRPEAPWDGKLPPAYEAPRPPQEIKDVESLHLAGLHLEQYRHPTLRAEDYWEEALRREPGNASCNLALGRSALRRGLFKEAECHFRKAAERQATWNFNPYDGEALYCLGLSLRFQGHDEEARKAFAKATWNYAWQTAGNYELAQLDLKSGCPAKALERLNKALAVNAESLKCRDLKSAALRRLGETDAAKALAIETAALDPLDIWARNEIRLASDGTADTADFKSIAGNDIQLLMDLAFDYASAGLPEEALEMLAMAGEVSPRHPMTAYAAGVLQLKQGRVAKAHDLFSIGAKASPLHCFPARLEELQVLQSVLSVTPGDFRAKYYLGNLLYSKKRHAEAMAFWQESIKGDSSYFIPWRNLGLASYNFAHDIDGALNYYREAVRLAPQDSRALLEFDELQRRKGAPPEERIELLERRMKTVEHSEELLVSLMSLYNRMGRPERTLQLIQGRQFHPWEGGEGAVASQYVNACWLLGRQRLDEGNPQDALRHFEAAAKIPENIGAQTAEPLHNIYYRALALAAAKRHDDAKRLWLMLTDDKAMKAYSYYQYSTFKGLALIQIGQADEGRRVLKSLKERMLSAVENITTASDAWNGHPSPIFAADVKRQKYIDSLCQAALAEAALNEGEEAKRLLERVMAIAPDNLLAWETHRRLKA